MAKKPAKITLRQVASAAGVSAMSVSRVINDKPGVGLTTRRKIEETLVALDFAPSKLTDRSSSSLSHLIGLLVPDIANPFFTPIVGGVERAIGKASFRLLLCNSDRDLRLERHQILDLISHRVDGLIVAPVSDQSERHLERLVKANFPIVFFDRVPGELDCDSVTLDNFGSAQRMVRHLFSVGHRRIAYISAGDNTSVTRDRLGGVRYAAQLYGIELNKDLTSWTTSDDIGGYKATRKLLARSPRPTAIFAVNNLTALGAMRAIRDAQLRVPEDIALVCFDDVQNLAIMSPFMTVIEQPEAAIGSMAATMLVDRITGRCGAGGRSVQLLGRLIVRQSCGSRPDDEVKFSSRTAREVFKDTKAR